ncbi:MAG: oligosaccharide repeat unit polymerase [Aphanocapsa sp. GSE-SYN-MK-11-07L]|jgi:oligosaccharide repeat unit polymerase|nr:oligosaccharide repeat unit polymerase [Aphanocapsa sp. GSE-SYN-MK-11-07L]
MTTFYLDVLVLSCLALLSWGLVHVERVYQYPFFMGSVFTSFILPQAFSLVSNPGPVTPDALERVLIVSCLCVAACWVGYTRKPNLKWLIKLDIPIDQQKLFRAGLVLMVQGLFFNYLLSNAVSDLEPGAQWSGPATIYLFFSQTINIAFAIFLLQMLKHPKLVNITLTIISGFPLINSVLGGRRTPTITLLVIVGISLFMVRKILPPRWLVTIALLLMLVIIPTLGAIRSGFWDLVFSGNWSVLQSAVQSAFEFQQSGEILELRNAALLMDASEKLGLYGYGSGWWDNIVFQYVPAQIVGREFKESLQFNLLNPEKLQDLYGYTFPVGTTYTGIGDSFVEFGYLGWIVFALIGYVFKQLWISAVYQENIFSRFLYIGLISPVMLGITHGIGVFLSAAIFQIFFSTLAAYYARANINSSYKNI